MKRLILLFIITILIKGYANECTVDGTTCTGSEDGNFQCEYKEGQCITKYYCDKVENINEGDCANAITSNEATKCVYDNTKGKCEYKEKCLLETGDLDNSVCNAIETSNPDVIKCVLNNEENACEIKEICLLTSTENDCAGISTLTPTITKCVFDEEGNKCVTKNACQLDGGNVCQAKLELSASEKCVYDSGNCVIKKICNSLRGTYLQSARLPSP